MNPKRGMAGVVLLVGGALGGCSQKVNEVMNSWVGRQHSELVAVWGAPTREMSDGGEGKILVYEYPRNRGMHGNVDAHGNFYARSRSYTATREFFVDSGGRIYRWRWSGL